jgi:type IV pilus assembly protein PilX
VNALPPPRPVVRAPAWGFSLIVAMLMLAVIGLASAAIMRNATSGDQVANGNRLQAQASQYAQLALRLCENQLAQPAAARSVALLPAAASAAWSVQRNWTQAGAGSAHRLTAAEIGSATRPRIAPQCLMKASGTPNVVIVTARGFSADFAADGATGATRSGSTVWLQATIFADGGAPAPDVAASANAATPDGRPSVRRRVWQQLLTPPF